MRTTVQPFKSNNCFTSYRRWRTRPSRTVYCHQSVGLKVSMQRRLAHCICMQRQSLTITFGSHPLRKIFVPSRSIRLIYSSWAFHTTIYDPQMEQQCFLQTDNIAVAWNCTLIWIYVHTLPSLSPCVCSVYPFLFFSLTYTIYSSQCFN